MSDKILFILGIIAIVLISFYAGVADTLAFVHNAPTTQKVIVIEPEHIETGIAAQSNVQALGPNKGVKIQNVTRFLFKI